MSLRDVECFHISIDFPGYAIIQLPEFLLNIRNRLGKRDGKISNDTHCIKKNDRKLEEAGNEAKYFNDKSQVFMLRMAQFEKEVNERFETMEVKIRNS